ncbi:TadE/TadG family type IV pilus assembly protein [Vibrio diazotrophicus]|uniref:TadE/TadG family type IV pilus assembly protein n=1 Tax=Vibrio diazotrophicus TaxID=685 RepID=UPI00142E3669|nr:TadE/TadG family type IV pilus assembly protein [Vibrio diazotrophicus]NIY91356.1 pilus assembly protein [Vibrio diazotrophicus]
MKNIRCSISKGIAAVEFLIILPVLLFIFTSIVEFGTAFVRYNTLSKSVQNAARYSVVEVYGSVNSNAIADVNAIKNMVVYGRKSSVSSDGTNYSPILNTLTTNDVTVSVNGNYVLVTASYIYSPVFQYIPLESFLDLNLNASSMMRITP